MRSDRSSSNPACRRRVLLGLGAVAIAAALGCGPKVHAERVTDYPLEQRKTYAWATEEPVLIQFGEPQPNVRTPENEQRLRAAIDRALGERGLAKVAAADAEVLVAFSVGTEMRYRLEGGSNGASIGALQPGAPQTKGTLNIYVFDRAEAKEVWHGSTSKWLSKSEDPDAVVNDAVDSVMAAFPGAK